MRIRSTITALSTALAFAVMLTAASTPAFAAKTTDGGDTRPPVTVDPTDKKPKYEQAKPAGSVIDAINPPQPKFKPDVRVVYLDFDWDGSGKRYHFRVDNIGIETATNISLGSSNSQQSDSSTATKKVTGSYDPIPSLVTGQSQTVTVSCDPQPGYHCVSASLSAQVADDDNPSNNAAGSN